MYYVYALTTEARDRIYVGIAQNVDVRLWEHNAGRTKSTSPYRPWYRFFCEEAEDRVAARAREKCLKSGSGKELLKTMLPT